MVREMDAVGGRARRWRREAESWRQARGTGAAILHLPPELDLVAIQRIPRRGLVRGFTRDGAGCDRIEARERDHAGRVRRDGLSAGSAVGFWRVWASRCNSPRGRD